MNQDLHQIVVAPDSRHHWLVRGGKNPDSQWVAVRFKLHGFRIHSRLSKPECVSVLVRHMGEHVAMSRSWAPGSVLLHSARSRIPKRRGFVSLFLHKIPIPSEVTASYKRYPSVLIN